MSAASICASVRREASADFSEARCAPKRAL
jgi:hypothetical protein